MPLVAGQLKFAKEVKLNLNKSPLHTFPPSGQNQNHLRHESVQEPGTSDLPEQGSGEGDPEVQRPFCAPCRLRGRCFQSLGRPN